MYGATVEPGCSGDGGGASGDGGGGDDDNSPLRDFVRMLTKRAHATFESSETTFVYVHLGGLVLDARHRVCADAFTPRSVRQELRAAGSEAAAAEAVANVAVEAMAEARFRHGPAARVAVLVLRVGEYDVIAAVEGVAAVPRPVAPPAASDTRELVLWRPTPSTQPPRTQWTIPVAPVELPPPPPAAVTPP